MRVFKLTGVIQQYNWGGTSFLSRLTNQVDVGQKAAEYWMGAHDKAPSLVNTTGETLNDLIRKQPSETLGEQVYSRFGRLPFLFKVLDVRDLLSIQVHPSKKEAEKGFALENEQGVPLSAAHRNYKDDNHKPEIMVALGEFWLLHGFKPQSELMKTLQTIPELSHLTTVFQNGGYQGLYKKVMEESVDETNEVLMPLIQRLLPQYQSGVLAMASPEYWAIKAYQSFCPEGNLDKGIYSIFFFNIVRVQEGEAVFQDAGVPHAYMLGQNIELMANSDNVLRGGLTPKHVDVPELLKHITFKETIPDVLNGEVQPDGVEQIYKSPAPDFELSKLIIEADKVYESDSLTLEIFIVIKGEVKVRTDIEVIVASAGEVFAVVSGTSYQVQGHSATLYKAKCPV